MARNKYGDPAKYMKPFPTMLRKLMQERNETQENIAKITGKTRQTISQYVNGASEPGYETLVKIADHFQVTTDYLLGVSCVSSRSLEIQDIVDKTGLTEKNVQMLIAEKQEEEAFAKKFHTEETSVFGSSIHLALLNFLVGISNNYNCYADFANIAETLQQNSVSAYLDAVLNDPQWENDNRSRVRMADAICQGVADYFNLEIDNCGTIGAQRGLCSFNPEDAFDYYCSRFTENIKKEMTTELKKYAKWGNIEPIREELYKKIDARIKQWEAMEPDSGEERKV